jgi:hypothetical protein
MESKVKHTLQRPADTIHTTGSQTPESTPANAYSLGT